MRLMTPCVWRILCPRNSSSVPYFRQPLNLPTAALRHRKCTECSTISFGRNRMSAESAHLSHSAPKLKPKPKFGRPLIKRSKFKVTAEKNMLEQHFEGGGPLHISFRSFSLECRGLCVFSFIRLSRRTAVSYAHLHI